MATRSSVGLMDKKGRVRSIYVHSDGYPEYMGALLTTHYTDIHKIKEVLALGDASFLGESPDASEAVRRFGFGPLFHESFRALRESEQESLKSEYLSGDFSVFYGRDRGEDGVSSHLSNNLTEWLRDRGQSYNYVFYEGNWYGYEGYRDIDISTGQSVEPHNIPGSRGYISNKKKVKYTKEDADRDMRDILRYIKRGVSYHNFGVVYTITEDEVKLTVIGAYIPKLRVHKNLNQNNPGFDVHLPTEQFYKDSHRFVNPKPQTMGHIREYLYKTINYVIQNKYR